LPDSESAVEPRITSAFSFETSGPIGDAFVCDQNFPRRWRQLVAGRAKAPRRRRHAPGPGQDRLAREVPTCTDSPASSRSFRSWGVAGPMALPAARCGNFRAPPPQSCDNLSRIAASTERVGGRASGLDPPPDRRRAPSPPLMAHAPCSARQPLCGVPSIVPLPALWTVSTPGLTHSPARAASPSTRVVRRRHIAELALMTLAPPERTVGPSRLAGGSAWTRFRSPSTVATPWLCSR
jgi:hypothetical protein